MYRHHDLATTVSSVSFAVMGAAPWHNINLTTGQAWDCACCTYAIKFTFLCFVDRAPRYNLCKQPTWRTVLSSYVFISVLYMFRTSMCPSSGELIVSIRHLVYVTLCRWPSGMHNRRSSTQSDIYQHRVTYTRCRIDTINSPDDGHMDVRNM